MFGVNPYIGGALAAIVIAALTFGGCEHHSAELARDARSAAVDAMNTAIEANKSNLETIVALEKALNEWKKLGIPLEQVADLAEESKWYAEKLATLMAQNAKLKESDSVLPECMALLRQSVNRVCPGIARGLRNTAEGRHEDGDGRDPGASGEAASGAAHEGLPAAVPLSGG